MKEALVALGLRFAENDRDLLGCPDIVLRKQKIVVFCDGDFWHGRNWRLRRARLETGSNADYWLTKISYNMARDKRQRATLRRAGWTVLRLWETDVLRPAKSAARVQRVAKKAAHATAAKPR